MWTEDEDNFCNSVGNYFVQYTRNAELHGIRYLSRRTAFERLLWAILTLCCVLACMAQIIKVCARYHQSPVVVTFGTATVSLYEIPFPAITICPETKSSVKQLFGDIRKKMMDGEDLTEYEAKIFEYLFVVCDHIKTENDSFEFTQKHFSNDFYASLKNITPPFERMMSFCYFVSSQVTCSEIFTPVFIDEGICYTFNILDKRHIFKKETLVPEHFFNSYNTRSDWQFETGYKMNGSFQSVDYPYRVLSSGASRNLRVIISIDPSAFDFDCKTYFQGYKVIIHNPMEVPRTRQHFFRMSPDRGFIAAVTPSLILTTPSVRRFDPRNRNCYMGAERPLKYFKQYLQSNCLLECLSNYTLLRCECVGFHMPRTNDIPICAAMNYDCLRDAEDELELVEIKSSLLDNDTLPSFCDCLPSCTNLKYQVEVSTSELVWTELMEEQNISEGVIPSELSIYFKHDHFVMVERKEVFSVLGLIAKVGGLIGLYTGASIVTVIEFLYFWTARLICNKRLYGRWLGPQLNVRKNM